MGFDDYQKKALEGAIYPNIGSNPTYPVLGLAGEVGEVAEKVKKVFRDSGGVFTDEAKFAIIKELGDVLWYVTAMAHEMGSTLGEVAHFSLEKIAGRIKRGTLMGSGDDR